MLKIIFVSILIAFTGISIEQIYSQEIKLSTFQESAQLIIDEKISQTSIVAITLLSTNIQEIVIPMELELKLRDSGRIQAVIITNENNCVLGVVDQSCIIINVERDPNDAGINAIQDSTKKIGNEYIEELNQLFDTNAELFQVYIHTNADTNEILNTSGIVSGTGTISAVYTMPMEDTSSMYQKLSSMLITNAIREKGGFYDIAKTLSTDENAKMTFSIIPAESESLLQFRISVTNPIENQIESGKEINPLEFFNINELSRSNYFPSKNYPLNSIFQVVILSNEETNVSNVKGNIIPTQITDGIQIPTDITKKGWVFDPMKGEKIQGKYLFGESVSINENELKFSLSKDGFQTEEIESEKTESEESIIIVSIIAIISIGAAIFYLKGYKK